jgi:beta-lactamase regulating signal transducer with metallopeptidase domain/protocatechuate 3,4-dioxygenase beta subunit
MVDFAFRGDVLMRDLLVQSTVIFAVGLLVARYARLPARAHAVLLMAFLGAVATPLASGIVRYRGWGILEPQVSVNVQATRSPQVNLRSDMRAQVEQEASYAAARQAPAEVGSAPRLDPRSSPDVRDAASRAIRTSSPSGVETAVARLEAAPEKPRGGSFSAVAVFAALWFIGSVIAVGRLLCAMLGSRRLMAAAEPCQVETVESALRLARERLGFESLSIHVFESPALRCPVIWCWGRCPRLVLPCEAAERWSTTAWTPILCHELAHWKRHDHLTALAAELVCCLIPWQPLAWWAKRRLEQASEQACDDWAVAAGHSATDYAETLLGLIAQPGSPLQLAALRRKSGLGDRIRHILTQRVPRPRLGRGWTFVIVIGTAAITGTAAFCQRGEVRAESATAAPGKTKSTVQAELEKNDSAVSPAAQAAPVQEAKQDSPSDQPKHYTAAGRVIGPDSQPIAGANVIWETKRVEKPKDWEIPPIVVAQATTDAEGRFSLDAELIEKHVQSAELVIRAAGHGLRSYMTLLPKLNQPLEIQLEPSYAIEGNIFTPNGEPIKDANVFVYTISCYAPRKADDEIDETKEWYIGVSPEELFSNNPRSYWPVAAVTDENGQFRFDDLVPKSATAELVVLAKDFAKTRLRVAQPDAPHYPNESRTWREPKFTLVLENPYVVDGRFVDEKTGAGIPGVEIEVSPSNYGRGIDSIDWIKAKGDQEGRYTLRVGSADIFYVNVNPPLGYPRIVNSLNASTLEKLAGKGRKVNYDFKLRPGVILRGRVVAADTGDPVPAADVVYRPEHNRKLGTNNNFPSIKTAADGTFEVTGTDGKGFLLVDAPDKGFYRLVVDDKRAQRYEDATYPHGLLEIDVPAEGQTEPFVIALNRGRELVVRALDPAGKPVKKLSSAYMEQEMDRYFSSKEATDGVLKINAAQPGRTYRLFLFSEDAMAGIVTEVEVPEDGRVIDVRLEPCATIRGRYVYDGGAPAPEVSNFSHFRLDPNKDVGSDEHIRLPFYYNFARNIRAAQPGKQTTDPDGRFELNGIVPGVFIYLGLNYKFDDDKLYRAVGMLAPGEVKDMGDLVIQSR